MWDTATLAKYPLLGRVYQSASNGSRITVSSYDAKANAYRCIWSSTHGWSLIPAKFLTDSGTWVEVTPE